MANLKIFSIDWLAKLKAVFGITKWQYKSASFSAVTTSNSNIAALRFNNLTIGASYKVTLRVSISLIPAGQYLQIMAANSANVATMGFAINGAGTSCTNFMEQSVVFIAVADQLTTSYTVLNASSIPSVGINLTLEELPNHEITTQWT